MTAGAQARMPPIDLRACLRLRFVANIGIKRLVNASDAGTFECSCSPVLSANYTMTRRDFSRKAFAVGAATAASASRILGANDRIRMGTDRKSTRLNSSHVRISYAVFCLKK